MKVAFCFVTLGDVLQPQLWDAFFAAAPAGSFNVYCHPKDPAAVTSRWLAPGVLRDTVPTEHGDISIVAANLTVFAAAYRHDFDNAYFVLLSESAIPIVPAQTVIDQLERLAPHSLVNWSVAQPGSEHYERRKTLPKDDPVFVDPFFTHENWVVLHRRHVTRLIGETYFDRFARMFAPDEHYIMNVLVHAKGVPLDEFICREVTFVNWRDHEIKVWDGVATKHRMRRTVHPKTYQALTARDLAEARGAWFFRKVTATSDCRLALERLGARPVPQGS